MEDAKHILKMIETVSKDDSAKLDEIDARVWCWLNGYLYVRHPYSDTWNYRYKPSADYEGHICASLGTGEDAQRYTRSRDALKSIRPKNASVTISAHHGEAIGLCTLNLWVGRQPFGERWEFESPREPLPTEELAELHAIIQAIEYERGKA